MITNESASSPDKLLVEATTQLVVFSSRLRAMQEVTRQTGFREVILGSRDDDAETFLKKESEHGRSELLPIAIELEAEMTAMATQFSTILAPAMSVAHKLCQDTPCGGMTWRMASGDWDGTTVQGKDTPCGKLHQATTDFVKLTFETRADAELGSRAACFLRMARLHNAPIGVVARGGGEGSAAIKQAYNEQKVPTPWLRSDEEYQKYMQDAVEAEGGREDSN